MAMVKQLHRARLLNRLRAAGPRAAVGIVAGLAVLGSILPRSAPSPKAPGVSAQRKAGGLPLVTTPDPIVLGAIEPADGSVSVRNTTSQPITLRRIETSCPCVHVAPIPMEFGAGETRVLHVGFISAPDDTDLVGRLLVSITGYAAGTTAVLRARVQIDPGTVGQTVDERALPKLTLRLSPEEAIGAVGGG